MKYILSLFISLSGFSAFCQFYAEQAILPERFIRTTNHSEPYDIDADGDADIMAIEGAEFGCYLNDGVGNFQPFLSMCTMTGNSPNYTRDILFSDINNDGLEDLVYKTSSTTQYYGNYRYNFLLRTGPFSFDPSPGLTGFYVDMGDPDLDGDLDFLDVNLGPCTWHRNDGAANFSVDPTPTLTLVSNDTFLDYNGDGRMDMFDQGNYLDATHWSFIYYEQLSDGSFNAGVNYIFPSRIELFADMNGDGFKDAISIVNSTIVWFDTPSLATVSWTPHTITQGSSFSTNYLRDGTFLDYDNDNDLDFYFPTGHSNDRKYGIYVNDGSGNFTLTAQSLFIESPYNIMWEWADFNDDGNNDYIINGYSNLHAFGWCENLLNPDQEDLHILYDHITDVENARACDVDHDNDIDIVATIHQKYELVWFENIGNEQYADAKFFPMDRTHGVDRTDITEFKDLDNDGSVDLLLRNHENMGTVFILEYNSTTGIYETTTEITTNGSHVVSYAFFEDWNMDGNLDFATNSYASNYYQERLRFYLNDGAGHFTMSYQDTVPNGAGIICDVDNDGFKDVLTGSPAGDYSVFSPSTGVGVMHNNGDGTFDEIEDFNPDLYRLTVCDDVDSDGDDDFVAYTNWWLNDGSGNYLEGGEFMDGMTLPGWITPTIAGKTWPCDINQDGTMDFISRIFDTSINPGEFIFSTLLTNSTDLTFLGAVESSIQRGYPSSSPNSSLYTPENFISISDINNDGYPDILNPDLKNIYWIPNAAGGGCTDASACGYEPNAFITWDDGSCCYFCGCMDPLAFNFSSSALCEDGSCMYNLSGHVFDDTNGNGIEQNGEVGIAGQVLTIMPGNITAITDSNGDFFIPVTNGQVEITLNSDPNYPFFTTPQTLSVLIGSNSPPVKFGLHNADPFHLMETYDMVLTYGCDNWAYYNIAVVNNGNTNETGYVSYVFDQAFTAYEEITPISSVSGDTIIFDYADLLPGEMRIFEINLHTPDALYTGQLMQNTVSAIRFSGTTEIVEATYAYQFAHTCAYDPNDKQAFPAGYTDAGYIENTTPIDYKIRFQNTGNASANDVVVRDLLDANLDLSTFQVTGHSHSVMVSLDPSTRDLVFYFNDIELPDSISDEAGSHGFVSYRIAPLPDLAAGTQIQNTANIYFDNNDAVVTNTTLHTIFDCASYASNIITTLNGPCEAPMVFNEADVLWSEEYEWTRNDQVIGYGEDVSFYLVEESLLQLTVTNPLCGERSYSVTLQVPIETELTTAQNGNFLNADNTTGVMYQWYLDGNEIEGAITSSFEITESGNYSLEMTTPIGCIVTSSIAATYTGMKESTTAAISLFPNPATDHFILSVPIEYINGNVEIFTAEGKLVRSAKRIQSTMVISTSDLKAATYSIIIRAPGMVEIRRSIVVKK